MILLVLALACGPRPPMAPEPLSPAAVPTLPRGWTGPALVAKARVMAVGDLLMHTNVKNSAKAADQRGPDGASLNSEGYEALFSRAAPLLQTADLAFANLETPIAPRHDKGTGSMVFNAPVALLRGLEQAGFDVVSFANNHVYDQGRDGFVETLEHLGASKLVSLGAGPSCAAAREPRFTEVNGIRVAWLAASKVYNSNLNQGEDQACSFAFERQAALAAVAAARAQGAEVVIFSLHWGREYKLLPDAAEVEDAHALLDGGVDLLLGHHPHVLQPVEIYPAADGRITAVAYSLGNFISNQGYWFQPGVSTVSSGNTRDGLILQVDLVRKDYGPGPDGQPQVRVELAGLQVLPTWTDNDAGRIVAPAPEVRATPIDAELARLQAALAQEQDPAAALALKRRIEHLTLRRETIASTVGPGLLPPLP